MPNDARGSSISRRSRLRRLQVPESLESRRMAAVVTYTDVDGDAVKVWSSKGTNSQLESAITFHIAGVGKEIEKIDLTSGALFQNAAISVTVTNKKGNGVADVGMVAAGGIDLASLVISGNLCSIDVGDTFYNTPGIGLLQVGAFASRIAQPSQSRWSTVAGGATGFMVLGDADKNRIEFTGALGTVTVLGSFVDSHIVAASIGTATVGHDLVGSASGYGYSGYLSSIVTYDGGIGAIGVNGNIMGGSVVASGHIGTAKVMGSLVGGSLPNTGTIRAGAGIDSVYVKKNVVGWTGDSSGSVYCEGDLGTIEISGNLQGGSGPGSGRVFASHKIGFLRVRHDIRGGGGEESGTVQSQTSIMQVLVEGALIGATGPDSGRIESFTAIKNAVIEGGIKGGDGPDSGVLMSFGNIIHCQISADVRGGKGPGSGRIFAGGDIATTGPAGPETPYALYVDGSLIGGAGDNSGSVAAQSISGTAYIRKSVVGGAGRSSGSIRAVKSIDKVVVCNSLVAGVNQDSGSIRAGDSLGTLNVYGNVVGNAIQPVLITAAGLVNPDAITTIYVKSSMANALVLAGYDNAPVPAPVSGAARLGTVTISGNLVASSIVAGAQVPAFLGNGSPRSYGTVWDVPIGNNKASILAKVVVGGGVFGTAAAGDHYGIVAGWIGTVIVGGKKVAIPQAGGVTPLGGQTDFKVHVLS